MLKKINSTESLIFVIFFLSCSAKNKKYEKNYSRNCIILAIALFSFGLNAQTFPSPYCTIADADEVIVEEITSVDIGATGITNMDYTSVLVDQTALLVNVAATESYTLLVKGNTYGNFDSSIVAFIDWNHNGVLDDAGEIYELGNLTNSDGDDTVSVSISITVPETAVDGLTRIRITKIYTDEDSVAIIDPCAISFNPFGIGAFAGYGQALDFTLNVSNLRVSDFDKNSLSIYPVPAIDNMTIAYKSAIELLTIYNVLGQQVFTGHNLGATTTVEVSNFAPGTYIAKISSESNTTSVKIIKK